MIPIFIIVHDRIKVLKKCIKSIEKLEGDKEIIIYNHNTTYKPCLDYLDSIKEKYKIYNINDLEYINSAKSGKDRANRIRISRNDNLLKTIKIYLNENKEVKYFCWTDCDIELSDKELDLLEVLKVISKKYNHKKIVGPGLRLDDIPDYYPRKNKVLSEQKKFWDSPISFKWKDKNITYYVNRIDTTFGLHHIDNFNVLLKKSTGFFRISAIRIGDKYSARHLDWYTNPKTDIDEEYIYYSKTASNSHWGKLSKK